MKSNDWKTQQDAKKRQEEAVKQADDDFVSIASFPAGQRFLWNLMARCHVFSTSFEPSSRIYFNEGERAVGLTILQGLNRLCPDRYLEMVQAQATRIKNEQRLREAAAAKGAVSDE